MYTAYCYLAKVGLCQSQMDLALARTAPQIQVEFCEIDDFPILDHTVPLAQLRNPQIAKILQFKI